ncbi:hypothetical protein GCM10020358_02650 [Amorphoplanes nipponensis]
MQGLQNILAGDQCMTVYKAIKKEAERRRPSSRSRSPRARSDHGQPSTKDPESGGRAVGAADPAVHHQGERQGRLADGYATKAEVCTADFAKACTEAGIS